MNDTYWSNDSQSFETYDPVPSATANEGLSGFFSGGFSDTVSGAADWAANFGKTIFGGIQSVKDAQFGMEINDIKREAVLTQVKNAGSLAQTGLPTISATQHPGTMEEINSKFRDVIVSGQAAQIGKDALLWGGLAVGLYMITK